MVDQGWKALGMACDVSDEEQVAATVDATVEAFGWIDMAFNNAGIINPVSDAADEPLEMFERIQGVNLRGVWACMKHELRYMREQGSGAIVNNSSLGGLVGLPQRGAYHASKHGVLGLTKCAALEYAPRGVRINAICPGTIHTPMVQSMFDDGDLTLDLAIAAEPIARLGTGEEIAGAVLWLCSPGAGFVVGVALPVDGGSSLSDSLRDAHGTWSRELGRRSNMPNAVIVDVVRSPMGKGRSSGSLADVHPVELLTQVLEALIDRTGIDPGSVDDVIIGCVGQVGEQAAAPGRQAWLAAGYPISVPSTTIERRCGSGQQALDFAVQGVVAGAYDIVIAGGLESMSHIPIMSHRLGGTSKVLGCEAASPISCHKACPPN